MEINATLVVQMVLFLFLSTCLSNFLFSPLIKLFDEREKRIQGARAETQQLQENARLALERVEETIRLAQRDARQILLDLKAEGIQYQRRVLDEARREAKEKADAARQSLAVEVTRIEQELSRSVPSLASIAMSQIFQHDVSLTKETMIKAESRDV